MPRNVLFITADQLRADCTYGGHVKTPNLDKLRQDGSISFMKHFCNSTPCGPSRGSLHTGCYMMNHCVTDNGTALNPSLLTWAQIARDNHGYDPVLVGYSDLLSVNDDKKSLSEYETWSGGDLIGLRRLTETDDMGSDEWLKERGLVGGSSYGWNGHSGDTAWLKKFVENESSKYPPPAQFKKEDSDTAVLTDRVIKYISTKEYPEQGFMMHLSVTKPHPPLVAPYPFNELYPCDEITLETRKSLAAERETHPWLQALHEQPGLEAQFGEDGTAKTLDDKTLRKLKSSYYALVSEVDYHIGRLLECLKSNQVYDDTLIIFTTDHGDQLGDHWMMGKLGFYDSSYHIPLIIRDPTRLASTDSNSVEHFTEGVDIMPSILDYIGAKVPLQCDDRSLMPLLERESRSASCEIAWRSNVFWEVNYSDWGQYYSGLDGVEGQNERTKWFGWQFNFKTPDESYFCVIRNEKYKLVYFLGGLPPLLFDMLQDPVENTNLADKSAYQSVLLQLLQILFEWKCNYSNAAVRELENSKINYADQVVHKTDVIVTE